jgi:hypothetical protein
VRRTQLYLEEGVWEALHLRAKQERYAENAEQRKQAMRAFAGIRRDRSDIGDTGVYIRKLRRGSRLHRLAR